MEARTGAAARSAASSPSPLILRPRRANRGRLQDTRQSQTFCSKLKRAKHRACLALLLRPLYLPRARIFHFRTSESLLPAQSAAAADAWKLRIATYL
jgi:hypothetical protein